MKEFPKQIISILQENIPDLQFTMENNVIMDITPRKDEGFSIRIVLDETESTIFYGQSGHHEHWPNPNAELEQFLGHIIGSLTGKMRQVVHSRNGKEFKWECQIFTENEKWETVSVNGKISIAFWKKKSPVTTSYNVNTYSQVENVS